MNKELNLCAVIMRSKPGYKTGKKHKIFDNLLNLNTQLAIDTLNQALEKEKYPSVILHSDQGVQYTSCEFVNFCKDNNVTQSMSKAGCPQDNAAMERFYNTFKSNFYNVAGFTGAEAMDELTTKYINWYNYIRPHSYNNYLTPMEARYRQIFIEQSVTKKLDQYNQMQKNSGNTINGFIQNAI